MKDAIGSSLLLSIVVIFVSVVILFFAGIIAYSKAFKVKNRIIEVIERNGGYGANEAAELTTELGRVGYRTASGAQIQNKCGVGSLTDTENAGYLYCVEVSQDASGNSVSSEGTVYKVTTFVHFDFPLIGGLLEIPVSGTTKVLGKIYNY